MISSLPVFIGLTLVLFGGCAWMTGQALAGAWRPAWQAVPYALLLTAADRFLGFALFGETLLSVPGFLLDGTALVVIALLAFRVTRVRRLASQYPWLYIRTGPFTVRKL